MLNAPHVSHQFDDAAQEYEASTLGMWAFLVTEVMFFGGALTGYLEYRSIYPDAFALGSRQLDLTLGTINTAVLLFSSLTMALAVHYAQRSNRRKLVGFLFTTMVLGSIFLAIKGIEYYHKFEEHHVPGPSFHLEIGSPDDVAHAQIFFSFYFALTGLHALHMIIGIVLLGVIAIKAWRGRYSAHNFIPVESSGLYWHFVDIVWVFLFPLLYLI